MSEDKLSDEEMEIAMKGLHDVWNTAGGSIQGGIVGGYLGSPTPEQIDHDIIGELSKLRQKVSDLETAKEFNAHIHDNIIKRLNEAERKLKSIEEQFLHFIELRKIKGTG